MQPFHRKPTCSDTANTEFRDSIMSELQQIYSRDFTDTAVQVFRVFFDIDFHSTRRYCNFFVK